MSRDLFLSVHDDEGGYDPAHCCACCGLDTSYGDHDAGCVNESGDLDLVEVLAASAAVDPFENMQPLGGPRKMPAAGLIPATLADHMGTLGGPVSGATPSIGGARGNSPSVKHAADRAAGGLHAPIGGAP